MWKPVEYEDRGIDLRIIVLLFLLLCIGIGLCGCDIVVAETKTDLQTMEGMRELRKDILAMPVN